MSEGNLKLHFRLLKAHRHRTAKATQHREPIKMESREGMVLVLHSDTSADEPMDWLFREACKVTTNARTVFWIRRSPSRRLPDTDKLVVRPNWLKRILIHYDYGEVNTTKDVVRKMLRRAAIPYALLVELQEYGSDLPMEEYGSLLALLQHASKWISGAHQDSRLVEVPQAIVVLPEGVPKLLELASLYADLILRRQDDSCFHCLLE